jgi:hypothetical protein
MIKMPFAHEDLELKQHFLNLAREFKSKEDSLEHELACALLYMNLADYLAEYLVVGLTDMSKEAMGKNYLGMVTLRSPKRDSFNIGDSMKHLERFDFPRKADVLEELNKINSARKKIAHQILKTSRLELEDIDKAVHELAVHTEELVIIVDEISVGLPPTNLLDRFMASLPEQSDADPEIQDILKNNKPKTPTKKDKK